MIHGWMITTNSNHIGQGQDKGTNLGYVGSYIYWAFEIALAAGLASFIMREPTLAPFCRRCQSWKPSTSLGMAPLTAEVAREIMDSGDLPRLQQLGWQDETPTTLPNPVIFTAHFCPDCGEHESVEINLKEFI